MRRIRRTRDVNLIAKKHTGGKPEYRPTKDVRDMVEGMAMACIPPDLIAKIVRISRPTLEKYFGDIIAGARERLLGKAAKTLSTLLDESNLGAACFVMKTQGKPYGWSERHEITGRDGDPLLPKLEGLTDEQLAQLQTALRVLAQVAPEAADRSGDRAPTAPGSTRIH